MNQHKLLPFSVTHARLFPKKYAFTHKFFWLQFDLLTKQKWPSKLLSYERFNLYTLKSADHYPGNRVHTYQSIGDSYKTYFRIQGIDEEIIELKLLTQPRFLNYVFNPISVIEAKTQNGKNCALLEVSNTFGEVKYFYISPQQYENGNYQVKVKKYFYISPFSDHDNDLEIKLSFSDEGIKIFINEYRENKLYLTVSLKGNYIEANNKNLIKQTIFVPFNTFKTIILIHFHALVLWLKGLRFYRKGERQELQRGVLKWKS